jgi:hypothetical protein
VVERAGAERERERISLDQARFDPRSLQVFAGEIELLLLDVDADEADAWEFLPQDCEDSADSAAELEEACTRLEVGAVADQSVSPVLRLLDKAVLLACAVAVDVLGDASRLDHVPVDVRHTTRHTPSL